MDKEKTIPDGDEERADPNESEAAHGDVFATTGPTAIALRVERLKAAAFRVIQKRERLPHPLFWSLFCLEVSELKKRKNRERELRRILLGPVD